MIRAAVITAGGVGRRMGSAVPKQYLHLGGMPMLSRTLRVFDEHPTIDVIVLTVPPGDEASCRKEIIKPFGFKKIRDVVSGGATRQESVWNGLQAVRDSDLVAIHDGVRPLVSHDIITATFNAAEEIGASVACRQIKETVKRKTGDSTIETIPRADLWLAHTPQTFRTAIILEAHKKARESAFEGTDDAVLVERLGFPVKIVQDSEDNIKITTPRDMILAELLLQQP
ncbi:2-C-methyl-D-erythritol 4-phosphate cytidylyltransferase [Desulfomonile tiedjei]|uniref:2-C-methyl-D-erythritol 4-phosphate cytidylyltransferase n=1 Tax=Desulfomonile tiedjei (strain ATCC 49306 / DSM 6799 / DCB-1) TaxID=706587 RepID=I4C899_DESTA|nr:2-C-methyl-D-erythritol 4-phosphate cytidylyltransferase [Desulfomonile tiedjei]AFM25790.1 2-C-methyl-D-erythritol 4-phosphate cytidylyltransferase [Desulfomonile tiedjei DSM 6799]